MLSTQVLGVWQHTGLQCWDLLIPVNTCQWTGPMGLIFYCQVASVANRHNEVISFTCPVTGIPQNMIYINLNTRVTQRFSTLTHFNLSLTHFIQWFSSRSLHEIRLPYQNVSLLLPLIKSPCLTSLSKENALFWELYIMAITCSATGLAPGCWCQLVSALSRTGLTDVMSHNTI